jgi:UDP-3-O-[3-hydroxymyristoyl] glucosamine N-acyltransferase
MEENRACRMVTSMAERTAKMVLFSATGDEKSLSNSRKADIISMHSAPSMTQCSGGNRAAASAPLLEFAYMHARFHALTFFF